MNITNFDDIQNGDKLMYGGAEWTVADTTENLITFRADRAWRNEGALNRAEFDDLVAHGFTFTRPPMRFERYGALVWGRNEKPSGCWVHVPDRLYGKFVNITVEDAV